MDRARSSRQERQRRREVLRGRFRGSGSRDGLTIITSPSVESVMAGSAVGRRRNAVREPASSRLQVPEPVLYHRQRSILTITPGNTQNSSGRISYPGRRMSAQVRVSHNGCTSAIPSPSPTDFNPLAMPVITPSHPDPTAWELDSGGQQASSRRNMATGLECTILVRSRNLIWDWTILVNPFPDPITLTEEVRTCWGDA